MPYGPAMTFRAIPLLAVMALLTAPALTTPAFAVTDKAAKPAAAKPVTPPPSHDALLSQSRAALGRGEIDLALRLAQSAIVANPASTRAYVALGDIYAETGQPDFARNFYESALAIEATDSAAQKALAALDGRKSPTTAKAGP